MSVRINDINVIDGFLLPNNGYTLHPNSDFTYEFNFDIDNMIDVTLRSYDDKKQYVIDFTYKFTEIFSPFLKDVKYILDQSRLSGVPINIVLEDGRPDLENDDFSLV